MQQLMGGGPQAPVFDHSAAFKVEKGQANMGNIKAAKNNLSTSLRLYRDYLYHVAKLLLQYVPASMLI